MITLIDLMKKKPDWTHEQFRDHYENVHAKLARYIAHLIVDYQRNYPIAGHGLSTWPTGIESSSDNHVKSGWDCITKMTVTDLAALDRVKEIIKDPAIQAEVQADSRLLFDTSRTQMFICEQRVSDLKELQRI